MPPLPQAGSEQEAARPRGGQDDDSVTAVCLLSPLYTSSDLSLTASLDVDPILSAGKQPQEGETTCPEVAEQMQERGLNPGLSDSKVRTLGHRPSCPWERGPGVDQVPPKEEEAGSSGSAWPGRRQCRRCLPQPCPPAARPPRSATHIRGEDQPHQVHGHTDEP